MVGVKYFKVINGVVIFNPKLQSNVSIQKSLFDLILDHQHLNSLPTQDRNSTPNKIANENGEIIQ